MAFEDPELEDTCLGLEKEPKLAYEAGAAPASPSWDAEPSSHEIGAIDTIDTIDTVLIRPLAREFALELASEHTSRSIIF
ncbi:uncharacterized protein TRUGW13939_02330 [Talaromyces rugulosus]|uniref:Uncharacterized protein n=1 Tax=Talaromyces rugulosus TaxID=121627 RepID=A0A7H8QMY3_TALRU|nr:uncharacterized protein TRUGW13939_02330 [Talaromyces rugulosus]QKX55238.1 hypothetical protein TRUGW13939_02330 [Talaromyces rugulosus]